MTRNPRQKVTVTSGYAYGVDGADLHVLDDGSPLYLLQRWRPAPVPDPDWLLELPSRMLNARFEVVSFTGRKAELAALHEWRRGGPRLDVRWLHGPGGRGKSRLAGEFARQCEAVGWRVVTATYAAGSVIPSGSEDLRLDGVAGLLMIVDYADRWPLTHLSLLLDNGLLHHIAAPTRVLLLGRSADSWPAVREGLDVHQADGSAQALMPIPDHGPYRSEMFDVARRSFALRCGITAPDDVPVLPGAFDLPEFGLPLALHMYALVTVDAAANGHRVPETMADLTVYLLDRECRHWTVLYEEQPADAGPARRRYRTAPETMRRIVFTAALTGAVPLKVGVRALSEFAAAEDVPQMLGDHGWCYPAPDGDGESVLVPLHPDRLAEDFIALTVPGHTAEFPAHAWAPPAAADLLKPGDEPGRPAHAARTVTLLASSAQRWPHLGNTSLFPLLRAEPDLIQSGGSAALSALADNPGADESLIAAVVNAVPAEPEPDLDPGIAVLFVRYTAERLVRISDPFEHAALYAALAWRLSNAGRREESVASWQRAVDLLRALSEQDPGLRPQLARAIAGLAAVLTDLGRLSAASETNEEALAIRRELIRIDRRQHLPDLGQSLNNHSNVLADLRRHEEALAHALEAVDAYKELASVSPAALPGLVTAIGTAGNRYADLGQHAQALAQHQRSLTIRREQMGAASATDEHGVANSLGNIAASLSRLGRHGEAAETGEAAAGVLSRLCEVNPDAYRLELAITLGNLCAIHGRLGRTDDAVEYGHRAVAEYRALAERNEQAYLPTFAGALGNLANQLVRTGRAAAAIKPAEEAVRTNRILVEALPDVHMGALAAALGVLGSTYAETGRLQEAIGSTREAVDLLRGKAQENLAQFGREYATVLCNLGSLLVSAGKRQEGLGLTQEALTTRRKLAAADPPAYAEDLAISLQNMVVALDAVNRRMDAEPYSREAVEIFRTLSKDSPRAHLLALGNALSGLGDVLAARSRTRAALQASAEAVATLRELPPGLAPTSGLARALKGQAGHLLLLDRHLEALAASSESVQLLQALHRADPARFRQELARSRLVFGLVRIVSRRQFARGVAAVGSGLWLLTTRGRRTARPDPEHAGP